MGLVESASLRAELLELNRRYRSPHIWQESPGGVTLYEPEAEHHAHGNFLPGAYRAIMADPRWRLRLRKQHSHRRDLPARSSGQWKELDSCMSSDALLMNVFCYPAVFRDGRVCGTLGVAPGSVPHFGFKARVPLASGHSDRTEVDLSLGELLVESKLTESDFQNKPKAMVERYRDFAAVFHSRALPQTRDCYHSYQLIRNVLAAHALGLSFCVLLDQRRPDLKEAWLAVMSAIRLRDLQVRCKTLTWQELATDLPPRLQRFLAEKYGIEAASAARA